MQQYSHGGPFHHGTAISACFAVAICGLLLAAAGFPGAMGSDAGTDAISYLVDGGSLCDPNFNVVQDTTKKGRKSAETEVGSDQSDSVQRDSMLAPLLIDGLVVDETITKWGRDFYDIFYAKWKAPESAVNFMITVREQPLPSIGTGIVLSVDNEIIFQARLQPRFEMIENVAGQAVYLAYRRLLNRKPPPNVY